MPNNSTKLALEASLKNLLLKKPVDKITITDLTNDCGITRMAFYYHFRLTRDLIMNVIKECSKGMNITASEQSFIADFYKYSFVGVMLDWIKKGMKENYHEIVNDICITMSGNIKNSLQNFADSKKTA